MAAEKSTQEESAEEKETTIEVEVTDQEEVEAQTETEQSEEAPETDAGESSDQEPDLEAELASVQKAAAESQDKMMRLAADYENYKKRMVRERDAALKYAEENILKELLPTVDNLERALDHEQNQEEIAQFMEGVELTLKGLLATLDKFGIQPMNSVGEPFDPNFHEAMVMEPSSEVPENHVLREFEKGYQYKDRLLRAAKVVVSKGDI